MADGHAKPAVCLQTNILTNVPSLFSHCPLTLSHTAPSWLLGMLPVTLNPSFLLCIQVELSRPCPVLFRIINIYFLNIPDGGSIPLHLNYLKAHPPQHASHRPLDLCPPSIFLLI